MFEIADNENGEQQESFGAKIRVIGIGGGGCNAVNTMIKAGLKGVEYIVANTDAQALGASLAPTKIQLGAEVTKGLGAGANPEVGRKAALEEYERLSEVLDGSDMVFITAGMGGGTGTGAGPVVAKLCKELNALTVGVVTKPFLFEGKKRSRQAKAGIEVLEDCVDSLITIPNQRLLYIAGETLSLVDTFKKADEVLLNAVRGISDLITNTGLINSDFADVHTIMSNQGMALMGTGVAEGENRSVKASTEAISSPLLEDITIDGATGIIINITGSSSLTAHETNEAVTLIMEAADEEAEIIFGTVIDDDMEDQVKVTVIATGLGEGEKQVETQQATQQAPTSRAASPAAPPRPTPEAEVRPSKEFDTHEQGSRPMPVGDVAETTPERPSLRDSLKSAAERYKENKEHVWTEQDDLPSARSRQDDAPSQAEASSHRSEGEKGAKEATPKGRARSIAERLGFLNFDEEELDRPTYLRKEDQQERNSEL